MIKIFLEIEIEDSKKMRDKLIFNFFFYIYLFNIYFYFIH